MRTLLFVSLRQLMARKVLNGVAVLGVALGVITLIAMSGIVRGFEHSFLQTILRISPHVTVLDKELEENHGQGGPPVVKRIAHDRPQERVARIRRPADARRSAEAREGVVAVAPLLTGSVVLANGMVQHPVELRGIEPALQERVTPISPFITEGSFHELSTAPEGILLGSGVAERLGARVGDAVVAGSPVGQRSTSFKVLGIFSCGIPPVDNGRVYVTIKNAQVVLGKMDVVSRLELRLVDPEDAVRVTSEMESLLGYDAESWQETNANYLSLFRTQQTIVGFVIGAILLVGGFGIFAIQVMIVMQKTRDIAILRSVGFRRQDVLLIFLLQGALISIVGALLGDGLGHLVLIAVQRIENKVEGMIKSDHLPVFDDPRLYAFGIVFALTVGLIASFIPAFRGSRVEPVDVLRGHIG